MGNLSLAEVKWTRSGETITDEEHKIWYCGEDSIDQYGVAFIVRKEVVDSIISCTHIKSRLMSIRIPARPHNITAIQVYAQPQTTKTRKSNSSTSSLIASQQKLPRGKYLYFKAIGMLKYALANTNTGQGQ